MKISAKCEKGFAMYDDISNACSCDKIHKKTSVRRFVNSQELNQIGAISDFAV